MNKYTISYIIIGLLLLVVGSYLFDSIFVIFGVIILMAIIYYMYDNFIKIKNDIPENNSVNIIQRNGIGRSLGNAMAILTVVLLILFALLSVTSKNDPGGGSGYSLTIAILMPFSFVFYFASLIILSLRYSREKSNMDPLSKITFYILFAGFLALCFLVLLNLKTLL